LDDAGGTRYWDLFHLSEWSILFYLDCLVFSVWFRWFLWFLLVLLLYFLFLIFFSFDSFFFFPFHAQTDDNYHLFTDNYNDLTHHHYFPPFYTYRIPPSLLYASFSCSYTLLCVLL
jgi:hypothetical protein